MKYPSLPAGKAKMVNVPELSGGLNRRDALNQVEDNQLTDSLNMWWRHGALRTRPGMGIDTSSIYSLYPRTRRFYEQEPTGEYANIVFIQNDIDDVSYTVWRDRLWFNGHYERRLSSYGKTVSFPASTVTPLIVRISEGDEDLGDITDTVSGSHKNAEFLLFTSAGDILTAIERQMSDDDLWLSLDWKCYAPLIFVNGTGAETTSKSAPTGTFFEAYNLLTPRFRCGFTTDGKGKFFFLPQKQLDGAATIQLELIAGSAPYIPASSLHVYLAPNEDKWSFSNGFTAHINRTSGYVWFSYQDAIVALPSAGVNNNMTIEAEKASVANRDLICRMQFATWFGGDSNGINGGTRLFVSGNPDYPNLVHWSDRNHSLYFPENNYAYIGDDSDRVTAFGKQADMLVIFKENSIHYATYVAGEPYTAEDVIEGRVLDVAAMSAKFPITQIHSKIGCDCPRSIQLCSNHLIWLNTSGKVFTLSSANQYSQRNVRELSGYIERDLSSLLVRDMMSASSCDYQGHYMLLAGGQAFLLDYNSSGFAYMTNYINPENALKNMPWYKWKLGSADVQPLFVVSILGRAAFLYSLPAIGDVFASGAFDGTKDTRILYENYVHRAEKMPIYSMFQTKQYDFGSLHFLKAVDRVYMGAGNSEESEITLTYFTDKDTLEDAYHIRFDKSNGPYDPEFITVQALSPNAVNIRRFGLRAECNGEMAVDGISIKYRQYRLMGGGY